MLGAAFCTNVGLPMFTTARLLRPGLASAACRRPSGGWALTMSTATPTGDAPAVAPSCVPCEGIGSAMDAAEVLKSAAVRLPAWQVAEDGRSLSRTHQVASFVDGLNWFNAIMPIAEAEGHHPDLSLVDWNCASALRGVTENDFIVAERIEALPVVLKKARKAKKAAE